MKEGELGPTAYSNFQEMLSTQISLQTAIFICVGFFILGLIVCIVLLCLTCIKLKYKNKSKISNSEIKSIPEKDDSAAQTNKLENLNTEMNNYSLKQNNGLPELNNAFDCKFCDENENQGYLSSKTESPESFNQSYCYNECQNTLSSLDCDTKSQDSLNIYHLSPKVQLENNSDSKYLSDDSINRDSDSKDNQNGAFPKDNLKSKKYKRDSNVNSKYLENDKRSPIFKNFLLKSDKPFLGYVPKNSLNK